MRIGPIKPKALSPRMVFAELGRRVFLVSIPFVVAAAVIINVRWPPSVISGIVSGIVVLFIISSRLDSRSPEDVYNKVPAYSFIDSSEPGVLVSVELVDHGFAARIAKRCIDVGLAASLLILLLPVLGLVSLVIWLQDRGPILFRQIRVGRAGVPFEILKFRTMVVNAEEILYQLIPDDTLVAGHERRIYNDPRTTRWGRVLRRSSIDELPQLFNVLRGEMSLVGPRPAQPIELRKWDPEFFQQLQIRPGITGVWQMSGEKTFSYERYVRMDLDYTYRWSVGADLKLLISLVGRLFGINRGRWVPSWVRSASIVGWIGGPEDSGPSDPPPRSSLSGWG